MKSSKLKILIILLFISTLAFSQPDIQITPVNNNIKYDTTRILDLSNQLSLWGYTIKKLYKLNITNTTTGKNLIISPNDQTNIGLGFNYKWMGLGIAFRAPWAKNDDDIYGKTKRIDFQLNIFSRNFGVDFSAQYYKGYYVANPESFIPSWTDSLAYPQLNDLETASTELSAYYFFNHKKFSYRAAFVRNEIQKKGAGSIILGTYFRFDLASAPHSFIPEEIPPEYKDTFNVNAYISGNYGLSFGYTYTFVIWKKFFINLSLVPGFGLKTMKAYTNLGEFKPKLGLSGRVIFRTAIGYEHKYFFVGITSISITNTFDYKEIEFTANTTKFRFFIGKRFDVSKKKGKPKVE